MNKLISKIVGVALGLTLATGIGAGIVLGNNNLSKADAAAGDIYQLVTDASTLSSGDKIVIGNASSGSIYLLSTTQNNNNRAATGTFAVSNNKITLTSAAQVLTLGVENSHWTFYTGSGYLYAASSSSNYLRTQTTNNANGEWTISISNNNATVTAQGSNTRNILKYNSSNGGLFACYNTAGTVSIFKEVPATSSPKLVAEPTFNAKLGSNELSVTYSNFTSGATINAVSDAVGVATVNSSVTTSGTSGTAKFTVTGVSEGTANISFSSTGAETISVAVTVVDVKEFTKISKAGQVVSGGHYLIAKTGSNLVMSTTQNNNNRGTTNVTGSDPYTTLESSNANAAIVTITAGTGDYAGYYTMYDPVNTGYLYAVSGNNYLRTGSSVSGNYYYWSISFSGGNAVITNKGNSYTVRNNGALISCYGSGQTAVDLYILTSELPSDVALSSISAQDASVQNGSTVTFSGTYLPANATEAIEATLGNDSLATLGEVIMSNGTFSVQITGDEVGSTTLNFAGADGHGSASVTLTITSYSATHTKVTTTSGLYNGMKVVIGNSDEGLVGAPHMGGNNLPVIAGSFSEDGSTLSNSAATAQEFTMWYLTIADANETNVSGWAFYANGRYLTCATGSSNYWKQAYKLSSLCLFTISISNDGASIVCADSSVARNTVALNKGSSCISAYASDTTYPLVDLYVKESSSNAAIAAGYEDFCLLMDYISTSSKGSGFCITDDYYLHAKNEYNNTLTNDQKSLLSANAVARLQAWAVANGDVLTTNPGTIAQAANNGVMNLVDNNSALIIVVITAFVSATFIGGYFFLRKKKEQ